MSTRLILFLSILCIYELTLKRGREKMWLRIWLCQWLSCFKWFCVRGFQRWASQRFSDSNQLRSKIPKTGSCRILKERCEKVTVAYRKTPEITGIWFRFFSVDSCQLPVLSGKKSSKKIRKISARNTASTKSPELHGTGRFRARLFALGSQFTPKVIDWEVRWLMKTEKDIQDIQIPCFISRWLYSVKIAVVFLLFFLVRYQIRKENWST